MNKLYKTDSNGKLRVLHIWTEGSEVIQESGFVITSYSIHYTKLYE